MLRIIAAVLLVMWLLGMIHPIAAIGTFIHALIVLAIVLFVIDLVSGGRSRAV